MHQLFVLFEHASGYCLFQTREFEEVAVFMPQVRKSVLDVAKFRSVVHLVAYQAHDDQKSALENMKCLLEGKLHKDLQLFLENNVPAAKKSGQPIVLGIEDQLLADTITDILNINCTTKGVVKEVIRGIRHHFLKLIKAYKDANSTTKSEFTLGHNYSREKVNFDATRFDSMIIQSLNLLEECENNIKIFSARVREWYSCHFPELIKIVPDHEKYIFCVDIIGDRKNMPEDVEEKLESVLENSSVVETILQATDNSMGMEIATTDLDNIKTFCERIKSLIDRRKSTEDYLKAKMNVVAPNMVKLVGEMVGARLISRAGGLMKLAKLPASTVQVLGAQKRLFRCLKDKKSNLKLGYLYESTFMGKTGKSNKGRLSRFLASKCCLASRTDCFRKTSGNEFGCKLQQEVEDFVQLIQNRTLKKNGVTINGEAKKSSLRKKKRKCKQKNEVQENAITNATITEHEMCNDIASKSSDDVKTVELNKCNETVFESKNSDSDSLENVELSENNETAVASEKMESSPEFRIPDTLKDTPSKCRRKRGTRSKDKEVEVSEGNLETNISEDDEDSLKPPKKRRQTRSQYKAES